MRRRLIPVLLGLIACGESPIAALPPADGDSGVLSCSRDDECPAPQRCVSGICTTIDASVPVGPTDGGVRAPRIVADPDMIEFGAFRVGVSVERTVTIRNEGDAPLDIVQASFDQNPRGELEVLGAERLPERIDPGDRLVLRVRYTAIDAVPDVDRLQIVSDDPVRPLLNIPVTAELKGLPRLVVTADRARDDPAVASVQFADTTVTTTRAQSLFIKNAGMGESLIHVSRVGFAAPNPGALRVRTSSAPPLFLSRGDVVELELVFAPTTAIRSMGTVVIESSDPNTPRYEIIVEGTGIRASLSVTPDPVPFGDVFVGHAATASLRLENVGTAPVERIAVGAMSTQLAVTSTVPLTLAPGAHADVELTLTAMAPGSIVETLEVNSTDPDAPSRTVTVSAVALAPPALGLSPSVIDFGDVHVFRTAGAFAVASLEVQNNGGSDLVVRRIDVSPSPITPMPNALAPIPAGTQRTIDLRYAPTALGQTRAILELETNDPTAPITQVPIRADAIDPEVLVYKSTPPAVPASPVDLGEVARGEVSMPVTVFVDNGGAGDLRLSAVSLAGSSEMALGTLPTLPATIVPGAGAGISFTVQYAPTDVGNDTATLDIVTNDRDAPLVQLTLLGQGVACPPDHYDINMDPSDGCEYACVRASPATEICNGADDDCNGATDEACPSGLSFGAIQQGTEFGGTGGSPFGLQCPAGRILVGLAGRSGGRVDRIQPLCAPIVFEEDASGSPEHVYRVRRGTVSAGGSAGGSGGSAFYDLCPGDRVVVGIGVRHASEIDLVQARCGILSIARVGADWAMSVSGVVDTPARGGGGGNASSFTCAGTGVGSRLYGRAAARVDRLAMECTSVDLTLR